MSKITRLLPSTILGAAILFMVIVGVASAKPQADEEIESGMAENVPTIPLAPSANTIILAIEPTTSTAALGSSFDITITVDQLTDTIAGWQMYLQFDIHALTVTGFTDAGFVGGGMAMGPTPKADGSWFGYANTGGGDSGGVASGALAVVHMEALAAGTHTVDILVDGDPNKTQLTRPNYTAIYPDIINNGWVIVPTYGVTVTPPVDSASGDPGVIVNYTLRVTNTGNVADTFNVTRAGNAWTTVAPGTVGPLNPGAGQNVQVDVTVDPGAAAGANDTVDVTFTSQGDPTKAATSTLTTNANTVYGVALTVQPPGAALQGIPGETVTYTLRVTNNGNAADTFNLAPSGNVWTTTVPSPVGPLAMGATQDIDVVVTIPLTALPGDDDTATVTATSQGNPSESDSVDLTTEAQSACVDVSIDDLQSDSPVEVGTAMHFTATVSGDTPITYTWDFGGAGTQVGTGANPTFDYASAGTYTVTLDVANSCPSTDTHSIQVTVTAACIPLSGVDFDFVPKGAITTGQIITFTASATGSTPITYTWDFGDSTPLVTQSDPVVTHTYTGAEEGYTVVMTATNCGGDVAVTKWVGLSFIYLPLVMRNYPPCEPVSINGLTSDSPVELSETMHFTAAVTGTAPINYSWDFGGAGSGSGTDGPTPTFIYDEAGDYTVQLNVSNGCPSADTDSIQVTVTSPPLRIVSLTSDSPVGIGEVMHFTATIIGDAPIFYFWNFGGAGTQGGTDTNPTFLYDQVGDYTVSLLVSNASGNDTASIPVAVNPPCDVVAITGLTSDSPVGLGEAMHFTATVTGTQPITYAWDLSGAGSGTGLDGPTPTFTYTEAGAYIVTLVVTNACGTDSDFIVVAVTGSSATGANSMFIPSTPPVSEITTLTTGIIPSNAVAAYAWNDGGRRRQ